MPEREPSDEELMTDLARGRDESLGLLHGRYSDLIFNVASPSIGRASAEEVVQDVFLVIWRKAGRFDPAKGNFRSWALRIAHHLVINELRRRSRRPRLEADPEGVRLGEAPAQGSDPAEEIWIDDRRALVRAAVEALPISQGRAVNLAFFENHTYHEVAESLDLPLGTAKSRIRTGLLTLRARLSPRVAAGVLVVVVLAVGLVRDRMMRVDLDRQGAALRLVTSSDVSPLRLTPGPGTPAGTHGNYRGRPGVPLAVMTFSNLGEPPAGRAYRAWGLFDGRWHLLGTVHPNADGRDLLVIEGSHLTDLPSALRVTLDPVGASTATEGPPVIAWPAP